MKSTWIFRSLGPVPQLDGFRKTTEYFGRRNCAVETMEINVDAEENIEAVDVATIQEYCLQVKESLSDILPRKKLHLVENEMINARVTNLYFSQSVVDPGPSYSYEYFPVIVVDLAVKSIVEELIDNNNDHDVEDPETIVDLFEDNDSEAAVSSSTTTVRELLRSLSLLYPDVDLSYLKQVIEKHDGAAEDVQQFLENNMDSIPERRTIQAVQFRLLSTSCTEHERLWQCPGCGSWKIIEE